MKLDPSNSGSKSTAGTDQLALLQIFPNGDPYAYAGAEQRLNLALGSSQGEFLDTGPSTLTFTITDSRNAPVGAPIPVALHDKDLQKGYYPLLFTPPAPGMYTATTKASGQTLTAAFQVYDKSQVTIPGPGDKMPSIKTPTTADAAGIDPICTQAPECSLHAISLDAALAQKKPIAFLVATPAFCQTAVCGPVLNVLLGAQAEFGDRVTMIHNEVYKSGAIAKKDLGAANNLAPAVTTLNLSFEPCLIFVRPDGTIMRRLDTVYDSDELHQALTELLA